MKRRSKRTAAIIIIVIIGLPSLFASFDRNACLANVRGKLGDGTISPNDPAFALDEYGRPLSSIEAPLLTLPGCRKLCGGGELWYRDTGPRSRLTTWLIPLLILIATMGPLPLDKRKYWMIIHLLGDPIDSFWSLLMKVEARARCYTLAEKAQRNGGDVGHYEDNVKVLGTLLVGLEELLQQPKNPEICYRELISGSQCSRMEMNQLMRTTAFELADSRTDGLPRTYLAVGIYLYQVIAAFVTTLGGGNTSPPDDRIGTAMFITWVIPIVLLNNAVGGFPSGSSCFRIIQRFARSIPRQRIDGTQYYVRDISPFLGKYRTSENYFDSQRWSGAIYTYRQDKRQFSSGSSSDRGISLLLLSILPITVSTTIGFAIIWHTPPTCHNFLLPGIGVSYFISAFITWSTWRCGMVKGRFHWYLILAKDTLVAVPSIVLIFLSNSGLFNSCWCWNGVYALRGRMARISLNAMPKFDYNNHILYPTLFAVCLGLQLCVFGWMVHVGEKGLRLMRWSEEERWQALRKSQLDSTESSPAVHRPDMVAGIAMGSSGKLDDINLSDKQVPAKVISLNDKGRTVWFTPWTMVPNPGTTDRIKGTVEMWIHHPINWWPFGPRKAHCPKDHTRISWYCGCGAELYVDILTEVAKEYREQCVPVTLAAASQSLLPLHNTVPAAAVSGTSTQLQNGQMGSREVTQRTTQQNPNLNGPAVRHVQQAQIISKDSKDCYVHWCVDANKFETQLIHIPILSRNDVKFIHELKSAYNAVYGLRQYFSLTTCYGVKFVAFERVHCSKELVACGKEDLPCPRTNQEYEYTFLEPREQFIKTLEKSLMHHFHNPHCCGAQDIGDILDRIPKKTMGRLEKRFGASGYGMHAVPGWALWKFFIALILSQIGPFIFAIRWLCGHPGDLQNAFALSMYVIGFLNLVVVVPDIWNMQR